MMEIESSRVAMLDGIIQALSLSVYQRHSERSIKVRQ